jgi:hypothetical protein
VVLNRSGDILYTRRQDSRYKYCTVAVYDFSYYERLLGVLLTHPTTTDVFARLAIIRIISMMAA